MAWYARQATKNIKAEETINVNFSLFFGRMMSADSKQLSNEVFVISRIIKVEVAIISRSRRLRLITLTGTLIILDIKKPNLIIFVY